MEELYEPFGEEWQKEILTMPKKAIVGLYRYECISRISNEGIMQKRIVRFYFDCDDDHKQKLKEAFRFIEDII